MVVNRISSDVWTMQEYNNTNCDTSGLADTSYLNVTAPGVCGVYPPPVIGGSDDDGNSTMADDDDGFNSDMYNAVYNCSAASSLNLGNNFVLDQ